MRVGLLFSGQGAQTIGMGKSLFDRFDAVKNSFKIANEVLGYDLSKICFEGPIEALTRTDVCQAALFVAGYSGYQALQEEGKLAELSACMGLSLGEWTALAAAGAISFEQGVEFVSKRGALMEKACEESAGAMASLIGGEREKVFELCELADVEASNFNAPDQVVISGEKAHIEKAIELASSMGFRRVIPLTVQGAYHSRLMMPAREAFALEMPKLKIRAPRVTVFSNVTGKAVHDPELIRELLIQQITAPVRWENCMQSAQKLGIQHFYECGAGKVLVGLVRKNIPEATAEAVI